MNESSQNSLEYKKIAIVENAIEAQLVSSVLQERDIPHEIFSFQDTAFDGLYQTQKGWGKIMAPVSYKNEILEIVSDLRKEAPMPPGATEEPE